MTFVFSWVTENGGLGSHFEVHETEKPQQGHLTPACCVHGKSEAENGHWVKYKEWFK